MNVKLTFKARDGKKFLVAPLNPIKKQARHSEPNKSRGLSVLRNLVLASVFCALAYALSWVGKIVPPVAGFLSYDPKDIIVAIAGFILGPVYSLVIAIIVSFLELFAGSTTGIIGCIMNIISTATFASVAALIYKRWRTSLGAIFGLIVSSLATTALMLLWNAFITPYYMLVPREVVYDMLLPVFLPFNLIKTGINSCITILIYKPVVNALRKAKILPKSNAARRKSGFAITVVTLFVLISLAFCFLIVAGII